MGCDGRRTLPLGKNTEHIRGYRSVHVLPTHPWHTIISERWMITPEMGVGGGGGRRIAEAVRFRERADSRPCRHIVETVMALRARRTQRRKNQVL
jgi:hypothetical protein